MEKYHLIIWEIIPEETHMYLVPVSEVEKHFTTEQFISMHNCYIGTVDNESPSELLDQLSELLVKWKCYKSTEHIDMRSNGLIELVICTGFLL